MKKLLRDLTAFAVSNVAVLFVLCVMIFTGCMTANVIEQYQTCKIIPFAIVVACAVLSLLMIFSATMMAYEEFEEFREQRNGC